MKKNDSLFNDFSAVSTQQWKQKINFELGGKGYTENLVWESLEGIKVKPFYSSEDIAELHLQPKKSTYWRISQALFGGNAEMANKKAVKALDKGAESILFTIPSAEVNMAILLKNINLKTTVIYLEFQFLSLDYLLKVFKLQKESNAGLFFNFDIINHLSRSGNWHETMEKDFDIFSELIKNSHSLTIDASLYQNAGATIVQQLAYALAHVNEYLNRIPEALATTIHFIFKIAVGPNYFFEIAKLRALRILWHTLATEYNINTTCTLLAIPSKRNKTIYDYNSNMLRTTTECMSAILGGADTICNIPYDSIYHKNNEFGERIARNQLLILKEESHFDKTLNAADGCYYVETLTKQLAEKALTLFKELENAGGFLCQLKNNVIQKKIKESAQKEQHLFDTQNEILIGTNKYTSSLDKMKGDLEIFTFAKNKPRKSVLEPIIEKRLAEAIEKKRLEDE